MGVCLTTSATAVTVVADVAIFSKGRPARHLRSEMAALPSAFKFTVIEITTEPYTSAHYFPHAETSEKYFMSSIRVHRK